MVQRSKRSLPPHEAERLHAELHAAWQSTCRWMARTPIGTPAYVALDGLVGMQILAMKTIRGLADVPAERLE
jgi:hypothetical protein